MRAASENLTPLTLELGGKSRVLIERSADLADAVSLEHVPGEHFECPVCKDLCGVHDTIERR
jgi:hypothetical protein